MAPPRSRACRWRHKSGRLAAYAMQMSSSSSSGLDVSTCAACFRASSVMAVLLPHPLPIAPARLWTSWPYGLARICEARGAAEKGLRWEQPAANEAQGQESAHGRAPQLPPPRPSKSPSR